MFSCASGIRSIKAAEIAQAAGLPSVFGHGMFTAGILAKAITDYVGVGNLRTYKIRFTKQTWPGEVLTTHVKVAKVYADRLSPDPEPDTTPLDHDLEAEVQAVAAWFDALPQEWQRYLDHEAQSGRRAYGQA